MITKLNSEPFIKFLEKINNYMFYSCYLATWLYYRLEGPDRQIWRSYKSQYADFVYIYKVYLYVKYRCDNVITTRNPLHTALSNYIIIAILRSFIQELNILYHEYERKKYLNKLNFDESLRYTNNLAISL